MKFSKPALTLPEQLQKWQSRGLLVADANRALHYLRFIGYYRFSAYTLPFQDQDPTHPDKHFKAGTTFEQVLQVYVFDRELRLLVLDAIERVEGGVRTCLVNEMSVKHGAHWFMEARLFKPPPPRPSGVPYFDHSKFLDKLDEELGIPPTGKAPARPHNEVFINHYYWKYGDPYLPPAWMVFEVLPMGRMSQVFAFLRDVNDRAVVAAPFGVDEQVLQSWLHCLSYVRNVCAHHRRLWNLQLVIKPTIAKKLATLVPVKDQFHALAVILHYLLGIAAPNSSWHERLVRLMDAHPAADPAMMGFPAKWRTEPFWGFSTEDFTI